MGNTSNIFISSEERSYRKYMDFKYEIFHSGASEHNTALYRDDAKTLKDAIEKANKIIKSIQE